VIDGYQLRDHDLDLDLIHQWLSTDAYWAKGRSRETVARSVENSTWLAVFTVGAPGSGVPDGGQQVGFARTITDWATFAWIADVYIDRAHRGRGLGRWLVGELRDRLLRAGIPRLILATVDAHGVYAGLGFTALAAPERWMEIDRR
jgi:GNAT superfamily N-acetyltransferase